MKSSLLLRPALLLLFAGLAGCSQPEAAALAPAPAEAHRDENLVTLTRENLAHVVLKTETVTRGSLAMTLKAVGRVSENLNRTTKVTSTLEGRIVQLNVDLNDRVQVGDVLALVQSPELLGKPLELKAAADGVITERTSTVGELVGRDTVICTISDPAELWVLAEIKERDIGAVRVGQEAVLSVLAYPAESFRGQVTLLGQRVESDSRTLEVRIVVANADRRLKPGMFADVEIATTALDDVLVISDQALHTLEDEKIVFVARNDSQFEKRVVQIGQEQHGRLQILGGLKEGERVVTEGSFILKSELLKGELGEEG